MHPRRKLINDTYIYTVTLFDDPANRQTATCEVIRDHCSHKSHIVPALISPRLYSQERRRETKGVESTEVSTTFVILEQELSISLSISDAGAAEAEAVALRYAVRYFDTGGAA